MHERELPAAHDAHRLGVCLVVGVAFEDDGRAERRHRVDLDLRCRDRHHDRRLGPEPLRRERDTLGVVAGRGGDDAPPQLRRRQAGHLVVRPAELEREDWLEVLALQEQPVAEALRQERRLLERRLDRDVVDVRVEDRLQVVGLAWAHRPLTVYDAVRGAASSRSPRHGRAASNRCDGVRPRRGRRTPARTSRSAGRAHGAQR